MLSSGLSCFRSWTGSLAGFLSQENRRTGEVFSVRRMRTLDVDAARQIFRTFRETRLKRPAKSTARIMPPQSACMTTRSTSSPNVSSALRSPFTARLVRDYWSRSIATVWPSNYGTRTSRSNSRCAFRSSTVARVFAAHSDCPAGLILNFNAPTIREGLQRVDRPDIYARKRAARQAQSGSKARES